MKKCKFRSIGLRSGEFIGIIFLSLLLKEPSYGYKLIEEAKKFKIEPSFLERGIAYRILRKLEVNGFVESYWHMRKEAGPPRRMYKITNTGISFLEVWVKEATLMQESLDLLISAIKENL